MAFLVHIGQLKDTGKYTAIAEMDDREEPLRLCTCEHESMEEVQECPVARLNHFQALNAYHKRKIG